VPGFRLAALGHIKGMGFVKQREMQMLFIERAKGDLCSAEDIG